VGNLFIREESSKNGAGHKDRPSKHQRVHFNGKLEHKRRVEVLARKEAGYRAKEEGEGEAAREIFSQPSFFKKKKVLVEGLRLRLAQWMSRRGAV